MLERLKHLFTKTARQAQLQERLDRLRQQTPVPVFWLFGKTQSGKTSLVRFLTGAEEAEIGHGFKPCTRFSREYQFPTPEAPLLTFLDTRGLDEPGYDPGEDLDRFHDRAHVIVATVKALDHAQEHVLQSLRQIHRRCPDRPIVLA
jgi:predicted GTPase